MELERDADRTAPSVRIPIWSSASSTLRAVVHTSRVLAVDVELEQPREPDRDGRAVGDRAVQRRGDEVAGRDVD